MPSAKREPDFMIIGAAKSATTSLHRILQEHPGIFMTSPKEPCFFSDPDVRVKGIDWYLALFENAGPDQIAGEGSTTYSRYPYNEFPFVRNPWPEIGSLFPDLKLVYMVRDPVDRAFSHYTHHMRSGVTMTFEEAIESNPVYLDCSRYKTQVEQVFEHFDRRSVKLFEFTEFNRDRALGTKSILEFLGVEDPSVEGLPLDSKLSRKGSHHLARAMVESLPGAASLRRLVPAIVRRSVMRTTEVGLKPLLDAHVTPAPMLLGTRERLQGVFAEDIEFVEAILGRELPHWRDA